MSKSIGDTFSDNGSHFVVLAAPDGVRIEITDGEAWTFTPAGARSLAILLGRAAFEVERAAHPEPQPGVLVGHLGRGAPR